MSVLLMREVGDCVQSVMVLRGKLGEGTERGDPVNSESDRLHAAIAPAGGEQHGPCCVGKKLRGAAGDITRRVLVSIGRRMRHS